MIKPTSMEAQAIEDATEPERGGIGRQRHGLSQRCHASRAVDGPLLRLEDFLVLLIEGDNKPGSLANISRKLAEKKVNIEYAYCSTPPSAKKGLLVLRVSDAKKALKILNS